MNDLFCVRVLSDMGESEPDFLQRLSEFWSDFQIREPLLFKAIYAESAAFEHIENRSARLYLVYGEHTEPVQQELERSGFDIIASDENELYSSYEALPPDWLPVHE